MHSFHMFSCNLPPLVVAGVVWGLAGVVWNRDVAGVVWNRDLLVWGFGVDVCGVGHGVSLLVGVAEP